ncbi:bacterial regulatory helix-turn-helix s, AraC family protein [Collimonas arenae]|uniref:Bacterial regulatory helix-turn-helix s, AraC family protein n=1 Tax=Collimonas arenae TaxID=279058 RepID=A0A127PRQ3_9BURK|nr:AraC family transcriptional regulator [Collimonas arenae]AMP00315.1 bacterial regulatory helix-turn-helix s, AraC family protein [Collimonas arenae]AMP10193.1 bacterial regulatory helix-turn-helix s, AraC family protein [Collimonas arenae]
MTNSKALQGPGTTSEVSLQQIELARLIEQYTATEGVYQTAIAPLSMYRCSQPTQPTHALHKPALCIIAQGQKQVMLTDELYEYNSAQYLVVTVDLPVMGWVSQATPEVPYLSFKLELDPREIGDLIMSSEQLVRRGDNPGRGMFVSKANTGLLDAVLRLIRLLETPQDIAVLAPLVTREILYRLLRDEQGGILQQIAMSGSQAQHIVKAIELIKRDYKLPLRIDSLAREANMSSSSLHQHFKAVTAMTPLQYQKQLRLQEARRLLFAEIGDAATAGHLVGYESPSQFSREYNRMFGAPPARDAARLRASEPAVANEA